MAAPDWLAYWGAGLSTALALRELLKHKRATRPKLDAFIATGAPVRRISTRAQGQPERVAESREAVIHNRGGASTELMQCEVCVASNWCPRWLLGALGELGLAPTVRSDDGDTGARPLRNVVAIEAGKEGAVDVLLWDEEIAALELGRLMLRVHHTWSRERPQQIRVKRGIQAPPAQPFVSL